MWRQALLAFVCWLAIAEAAGKTVQSSVIDNVSAESAPRLYRNVPIGVYASAAPYAAYSFHVPAFITAPKTAASRVVPVLHNVNGYLRDSYGNKFESPQTSAYKTAFTQQFLPLQELPAHLAQPLIAAAPKQAAPHYFVGSQYRAPAAATFQVQASQSPIYSYGGFSQPLVYAENVRSLSPSSASALHTRVPGAVTAQPQPSSNNAVYANKYVEQFRILKNEPHFQRLEQQPVGNSNGNHNSGASNQPHEEKGQIQAAPAKTAVTAIVNGKQTVINLDTKPVPLLDLSLLEPLTFENPLVPQVQHFLPRINQATYHKLPEFNVNDAKKHNKEFVVTKTKSYDSGIIKGKPKEAPKKKPNNAPESDEVHHHNAKPTVIVSGDPNESPEFTYEINSPNYKETYKEKKISYNKATESEPVNYSYDKKTESEPVTYSYQKIEQKEPISYNFVHSSKNQPAHVKQVNHQGNGQGPKQLIYTFKPEEQRENHEESDDSGSAEDYGSAEESDDDRPAPPSNHHSHQEHRYEEPRRVNNQNYHKSEQREEEYHHRPNEHSQQQVHQKPQHHVQHTEAQYHPQEYEENIRLLPPEKNHAPIKIDPGQHVKYIETYQPRPSPVPANHQQQFAHQRALASTPQPYLHQAGAPIIHEKAKRIIIQEETPEEMHSHREQIMAEMIDQEENNEEDFEKAYKNAAFGFPAYEKKSEDIEKDIYNPTTYGFNRGDDGTFDAEKTPFQEFEADGDNFPKTTRLNYKDARDNNKDDYYLDYSINKPEVMAERYKTKADYYKLYKKHKPENYFGKQDDEEENDKKKERYTAAPSYDFRPKPEKKSNAYFAQYKAEPNKYEYNYAKEAPRDNSAHASRPYQRLKIKTHFVEPQFQYGFEPISLPRLLDSELAAMASNHRPESEKPGMRKKIYKENWYIKKTSTSGGKPS